MRNPNARGTPAEPRRVETGHRPKLNGKQQRNAEMMRPTGPLMAPSKANDGYVTLAVLVIAGLLAAFVSTLLSLSRPALDLARIGADELVAQGLAEGGL